MTTTTDTYDTPVVTYRLEDLSADGREVGQYDRLEIAWGDAAYYHLKRGGDSEVAQRMLRHGDTGTVYDWQVGRHCDTTRHTVRRGGTLPIGWADALTVQRRIGATTEKVYVQLATCLVENMLEDALSGLDVVLVCTDDTLAIGIVTAVDDYGVLTFADGQTVDLQDTTQIHATHGGL